MVSLLVLFLVTDRYMSLNLIVFFFFKSVKNSLESFFVFFYMYWMLFKMPFRRTMFSPSTNVENASCSKETHRRKVWVKLLFSRRIKVQNGCFRNESLLLLMCLFVSSPEVVSWQIIQLLALHPVFPSSSWVSQTHPSAACSTRVRDSQPLACNWIIADDVVK